LGAIGPQNAHSTDQIPRVLLAIFGDAGPETIARTLDEFCERRLGSSVEALEFVRASVGCACGLRLVDGRRVVVKAHRPETGIRFLHAMQAVQQHLVRSGFPCPRPLLEPTPLANGVAVAESLEDRGETADAHDPAIRRIMAEALAELVWRCLSLTHLNGLNENIVAAGDGLWPRPHDLRFDFDGTSPGAEWIDKFAAEAHRILIASHAGERVVGHRDWRVEHMRFDAGRVSAVYDWDSLIIEREPVLVGSVAHAFTADWSDPGRNQFPTLGEVRSFVAEYETARGTKFSEPEDRALRAALVYAMAYTARCEHSDFRTDFGTHAPQKRSSAAPPRGSARAFLLTHAAGLLQSPPQPSTTA
jgi:hypothetical protein